MLESEYTLLFIVSLRVNSVEIALPFYEKLLPALGFTEDPAHVPNDNLVGFCAASREDMERHETRHQPTPAGWPDPERWL